MVKPSQWHQLHGQPKVTLAVISGPARGFQPLGTLLVCSHAWRLLSPFNHCYRFPKQHIVLTLLPSTALISITLPALKWKSNEPKQWKNTVLNVLCGHSFILIRKMSSTPSCVMFPYWAILTASALSWGHVQEIWEVASVPWGLYWSLGGWQVSGCSKWEEFWLGIRRSEFHTGSASERLTVVTMGVNTEEGSRVLLHKNICYLSQPDPPRFHHHSYLDYK